MTDTLWEEMRPLCEEHWKEVMAFPEIPLVPNQMVYAAMYNAGILRIYTMRDEFGKMAGYGLFTVAPDLNSATSLQSNMVAVFVGKSVRGAASLSFLRWCDVQLASEGVQVMHHHVKAKADYSHILERAGYKYVGKLYAKKLY